VQTELAGREGTLPLAMLHDDLQQRGLYELQKTFIEAARRWAHCQLRLAPVANQ
jgi:hypothetical protein